MLSFVVSCALRGSLAKLLGGHWKIFPPCRYIATKNLHIVDVVFFILMSGRVLLESYHGLKQRKKKSGNRARA